MTWKDTIAGRTIRRGVAIFLSAGIAALGTAYMGLPPEQQLISVTIVTSIIAALDKLIREKLESV